MKTTVHKIAMARFKQFFTTVDSRPCLNFAFAIHVCRSPDMCESINDTGIIYQAQIVGHKSKFYPYRCHTKPVIQISYRLDPTLTVMLSLVRDDIYFLIFSMLITLHCFRAVGWTTGRAFGL